MNRNLYFYGIFFLGWEIFMTLIQTIIQLQIGPRIFTLPSFIPWFSFIIIISLIWIIILLKYYHYKKYWYAFTLLIIATTAALYFYFIFYMMLKGKKVGGYYNSSYFLYHATGVVYSLSLILSSAGKKPWLKAAGILALIIDLFLISIMIWFLNLQNVQIYGKIDRYVTWISFAGPILLFMYIMNFVGESAALKGDHIKRTQLKNSYFLYFAGLIALTLTFFLVIKLVGDQFKEETDRVESLAKPFHARTFVNDQGDTLRYRLLMPLNYDSTKKYPLVVGLHGGGVKGTNNKSQIVGCGPAQVLSKQENRKKYPAFVFVPHCPAGYNWGGYHNHPALVAPAIDSLVFETIYALENEFSIDKNRCYVTGESLGGYGTWHFICIRPELFAAAVPLSGAGDPDLAPKIIDVPVWAFHGRQDGIVSVNGTRDMIEAIKKAGGNPRYTELPSAGHGIWYQVFEDPGTPGLLDWLFAQKKDR